MENTNNLESKKYVKTTNGKVFQVNEPYYKVENGILYKLSNPEYGYYDALYYVEKVYYGIDKVKDAYVSVKNGVHKIVTKKYIKEKANLNEEDIYAAVWTGSGLIYFARLAKTYWGHSDTVWLTNCFNT